MKKIFAVLALIVVVLPSLSSAQTATDVVCTGCVNATDLATNAVTSAKIVVNAVTSAKIANGTIVNADISSTAAIDPTKISGTAWTSTNDGVSSGLDANLLDGITSSQFLRSDQSGTYSGDLTVAGSIALDSGRILSFGGWGNGTQLWDYPGETMLVTNSDQLAVVNQANSLNIATFNPTEAYINGSLGIGITSPGSKLSVVAGADNWSGSFFGLDTSNQVRLGTYSGIASVGANNSAGSDWANLALNPGGGNVGIGTTTPSQRLQVSGPGGSTMALSTTDSYGPNLTFGGSTSFKLLSTSSADSAGSNKFILSNVGSGVDLVTVDHRGTVQFGDQMVFPAPGDIDHGDPEIEGSIAWYVVQLGSTGGTIYLQPGTYMVSSQAIPLADGVSIIGSGPASIIQADTSLYDDVINNEAISLGDAGVRDITLRDFQVIGNGYDDGGSETDPAGDTQDCIDIGGSTTEADYNTNITLSGLIVSGCGHQGIVIKHTQELIMSDIFIHDNGTTNFHHNIYLSEVKNAMLSNILTEGQLGGNGIKISDVTRANLSNVIANNNGDYGIRIDDDSSYITISSSTAYNNTRSGFYLTGSGTDIPHDVVLDGCMTYENPEYGIEVDNANNLVITGCTVRDNALGGIQLEYANRVAITGSMIYSDSGVGIQLEDANSVAITGSMIYSDSGAVGVDISTAASDILLVGNVNTGNGTDVGGMGSFSVKDNNL